jgi:hypothetical protein
MMTRTIASTRPGFTGREYRRSALRAIEDAVECRSLAQQGGGYARRCLVNLDANAIVNFVGQAKRVLDIVVRSLRERGKETPLSGRLSDKAPSSFRDGLVGQSENRCVEGVK